jgi:hypothetical protein
MQERGKIGMERDRNGSGLRGTPLDSNRSLTRAMQIMVREAVLEHKAAGNPVAAWRDGRVVLLRPEELSLTEPGEEEAPSVVPRR